ncbi:hydantoinase/oxoprolinase family protein [Salsipaludibacter albus]|uniref:hydantoinase/oxoprolinase family protein n=1 Tax=Salsipaludibacter albus TaxID=2849650 RepID=UPI001EE4A68D|nr:hydantoinase/oxoprolinase family protein [Salsipaludibacter albus]MBY5163043.1 hydantoinase/oxoprolinase family protein [Salsipaludibacter albus]
MPDVTPPDDGRRHVRIGVDTGGTFTDVVAFDERTGVLTTTKTPSTPADPARGFMAGIDKILGQLGGDGSDVAAVTHGTTVATNDLLEDKVAHMGLVTTAGYRHVLEIARQSVPDGYGNSYFWVKPDRIVPVDRVREVAGRLDVDGTEVTPLDLDQARAVAAWFRDRGIDTIGVCLLHSYADSSHEEQLRDVLAEVHPDAVVSISSEVLREYREYERTVTTLVDASVKPRVAAYIESIRRRLDTYVSTEDGAPKAADGACGPGGPAFSIMKSNGGVISAEEVVHQPITTVLSGPAAGALGAAVIAREAGWDRLLTCDGGGTSTDVSVVLDGRPTLTTEGSVGRFPSKIPMIDIVTVGAGGGSIAWLSPEGTLKVGPRSAGADPGPLCYGRGGTDPTITDAHLVLGRIPPHLLGGEIPLDVDAARTGIADLAGRLDMDVEACARGILEISAFNQANAIRQVTVRRGLDVRDFAMAAFGGSGPLLVCRLIDVLGLAAVVVPPDPGNLSAFGLLTVDVRNDYVQTAVARDTDLDLAAVGAVYDDLRDRAADALVREGFDQADHVFERTADLRYDGQAFEVRVDAPASGPVDATFRDAVVEAFHDAHEQLYGYAYRDDPRHPVEWVNLRVTGVGPITRPRLPRLDARDDGTVADARSGTRRVHFTDWHEAPIYWRGDLRAGDVVDGPAVVEEFGSTIPVHDGFRATVDELGNIVVRVRDDSGEPA